MKILITTVLLFSCALYSSAQSVTRQRPLDILIVGATVVTMNPRRQILENSSIGIRDGAVEMITDRVDFTRTRARTTINARGKVVIPGLINTHTHVPMTLFRGIADDLDLQEWLTKYIFPAEAKNVDEAFVRAGTRLGLAEMIRGGTTTYCDMYYFEDAIADETAKAGMRGVLGETILDFPAPDNKTWEAGIRYTENFIRKWRNHPLIVPAIAPHAPYTVSQEHLLEARNVSNRLNVPLVIHLAEAATETEYVQQKYRGLRPVEFVDSIGFLTNRTIAAHVIQVNERELDILKSRGVGVAHNPQSNMKLAAGIAPVPAMLRRDMPVGLGTDGAASNHDLSMWEEMDTAAKLHKVNTGDPKTLTAEQAFAMATIGGARALHMERLIGSIEVGKRADIAIVDFDDLHQTPYYNVYSNLVYATKAHNVRTVIINGRVVMLDRRLLTLNEAAIKRDANLYKQKIINSLAAAQAKRGSSLPESSSESIIERFFSGSYK